MIRGLQITIGGEELSNRIAERIRIHEEAIRALDVRLSARHGDQLFDIRPDDGFETLGELKTQRHQHASRVSTLALLRDKIIPGESYALSKADLRLAELISPDCMDASETSADIWVDDRKKPAIDGLKLTFTGEELRAQLERRMQHHQRRADWWKREQARTPEQQTEDESLLPDHMCENEAERHRWRAEVLGVIRDHIESAEVYRLGEADLSFGELLPPKPASLEQQEYEERTSVGFHLERLTRRVGELRQMNFELTPREVAERA